jgi:uracil phosphoribosyltransferase
MDSLYRQAMVSFNILSTLPIGFRIETGRGFPHRSLQHHGALLQELCAAEPRIQVYSFTTPQENHGEASRLIAKLRDANTGRQEFVYYTQRAFELALQPHLRGSWQAEKEFTLSSRRRWVFRYRTTPGA